MNDCSYDILDLLKKYNHDTNAALVGENCPQCLYAFSPLRENLFEWVEFEPNARVLQIGSDYGSFTGILAERAGEVVVLDALDENLEVNRVRHGERDNVMYVRGDLRDQIAWKKEDAAKLHEKSEGKDMIGVAGRNADLFKVYKPKAAAGNIAGNESANNCVQAGSEAVKAILFQPFDYIILGGFLSQCKKEDAEELLREAADCLKPGGVMMDGSGKAGKFLSGIGVSQPV